MSDVEDRILEQLECPVCMEFYREPKIFTNCGHTVCETCVGRMIAAAPANKKTLSCPNCRVKSSVPAGGFKTNYALAGKLKLCVSEITWPCRYRGEHPSGACSWPLCHVQEAHQ